MHLCLALCNVCYYCCYGSWEFQFRQSKIFFLFIDISKGGFVWKSFGNDVQIYLAFCTFIIIIAVVWICLFELSILSVGSISTIFFFFFFFWQIRIYRFRSVWDDLHVYLAFRTFIIIVPWTLSLRKSNFVSRKYFCDFFFFFFFSNIMTNVRG